MLPPGWPGPIVVVVVEVKHVLPASGREAAELAGVVGALESVLADVLPLDARRLGQSGRGVGGRDERQEVHDGFQAYWKVICWAVPVLDGPAPAMDCEAKVPNRLAVRKAPPARIETRP